MPVGHGQSDPENLHVSTTVIEAVADQSGREPEALPPLIEAIDPGALNRLFKPRGPDAPHRGGTVEFRYAGYKVAVSVDRTVEVTVSSTTD